MIVCLTINYHFDLETWLNIPTAHLLIIIILDICTELFVNPTRGSKDMEQTRKRDGQTDIRMDRQTTGQKTICLPIFMGGRHNFLLLNMCSYKKTNVRVNIKATINNIIIRQYILQKSLLGNGLTQDTSTRH